MTDGDVVFVGELNVLVVTDTSVLLFCVIDVWSFSKFIKNVNIFCRAAVENITEVSCFHKAIWNWRSFEMWSVE